jgi:hypothetical protein
MKNFHRLPGIQKAEFPAGKAVPMRKKKKFT